MQEELLNSVIKITKTRDVDSLEYSLISTIQEFIGCEEVGIYKDLQVQGKLVIERSLCLKVLPHDDFLWEDRDVVQEPPSELVSCLQSACIITVQSADGTERRWLPITLQEKPIGALAIVSKGLSSSDQVLLNAFCRIFENYLSILHENERDKLTGLLNRQTFEKKLKQLLEKQLIDHHKSSFPNENRKRTLGATSWLAMVDIDHFKKVNDNYGHVCGDEVLLLLAQKMRQYFRSSDLIFRFGGEEFVLVFEPCDFDAMKAKIDQFMELIRQTHFPFVKTMTVSIGMSRISPYDFPITVLEQADKALYYAKENGRDKLCFFEQLIDDQLIDEKNSDESNDIDLF
ncbi:GGDEF domain-containing protein [Pseudoalteromonas sp. BZB3]|uniref:diguanylate cyclase n=1 Tax=Pseudoalteromonas phenolica TaxID=161398 RepID=A0A5R9Q1Q9_9GAMM|nr:GGDEF domain-containing protein [Pseudoalteromonas phenolica]TLX46552.1 GGDEF domain-containing protein [Pseudoalteromonas phenolica]